MKYYLIREDLLKDVLEALEDAIVCSEVHDPNCKGECEKYYRDIINKIESEVAK